MELPQLFGSDYILPAIIAVVLLAAILGLLMLRRKRNAAGGGKSAAVAPPAAAGMPSGKLSGKDRKAAAAAAKAEAKAAKADAKAAKAGQGAGFLDGAAPAAPAAFDADAPQQPPMSAAPAVAAQQAQPVTRQGTSFANDPLQTVMNSILGGWGDLTDDDTSRLGVFKREKVIAAIAAVEMPKDLKSNEYARTRLTQLKRYAATLEKGEPAPAPETAVDEFAAIGFTPPAAWNSTTSPEPGPEPESEPKPEPTSQRPRSSWFGGAEEVEETTAESAGVAGLDEATPTVEAVPPGSFWNNGNGSVTNNLLEEHKAVDLAWDTEIVEIEEESIEEVDEAAAAMLWDADTPATETPTETPKTSGGPVSSEDAIAAAAAAFWAAPEAHALEEAAVAKAAAAPAAPPFFEDIPEIVETEELPLAEEEFLAEVPVAEELPVAEEVPVVEEPVAFAEAAPAVVESPTSAMRGRISTAADLMTLPADEQVDMLAFLQPAELSKVFSSTSDANLKRSVIDTLEHVGTTASLDAIHACLDDPDPLIQLYALDAADRLLGTQG